MRCENESAAGECCFSGDLDEACLRKKSSQVGKSQVKSRAAVRLVEGMQATALALAESPRSTSTPQRLPRPSPAGFRSTFDRLPYGCLLFM